MKTKLIFIFLTLLFRMANAQDCGSIKDGQTERLDAPGKSLENAKVQDQDGLGTCYANSASLVLQSVIPGHPEVSYLNLSVNYAEELQAKVLKRQGKSQAFQENGDVLIDGGFSCKAIDIAQQTGGVCARSDVDMEKLVFDAKLNQNKDQKWFQIDLVKRVSLFYDGVLRSKTDEAIPNEATKKLRLKEFGEYIQKMVKDKKDEYGKENCLKPDNQKVTGVLENIVAQIYNNLANGSLDNEHALGQYRLLQKLGDKLVATSGDEVTTTIKLKDELTAKIKSNYLDPLLSSSPPASGVDALINILQGLDTGTSTKVINDLVSNIGPDDKEALDDDYNKYVNKDISKCKQNFAIEYLKGDDGLVKDMKENQCFSHYLPLAKSLQQMVVGLDKYNLANIENINDFLMKVSDLDYESAIMKMLAPTCSQDKKIRIPSNLKCNQQNVTYPENYKTDPNGDEKFLKETKTLFQDTFSKNIASNKPVSISICTTFFDASDTFYNKTKECDPTKKHGFHAVTMIGYKCERGKAKYLIQNSWGGWGQAKNRFEYDSFGKAWLSEEDLAKSTYLYSTMDNKKEGN